MKPDELRTRLDKAWVIVTDVTEERDRQLRKWGDQTHPDGAWSSLGHDLERTARAALDARPTWGGILLEEVGEALDAVDREALRTELIQIAAVCVAWVDDLDRRPATESTP